MPLTADGTVNIADCPEARALWTTGEDRQGILTCINVDVWDSSWTEWKRHRLDQAFPVLRAHRTVLVKTIETTLPMGFGALVGRLDKTIRAVARAAQVEAEITVSRTPSPVHMQA